MQKTITLNKWLYLFVALAVLINLSGLFVPLMNPDATLYATIAKSMVLRNDYINIYVRGTDWLDKPHFPFWVAALFFKIFGISAWAYKLSGIVFMFLGAVYTWLFAQKLYNKQVAIWAVLVLLTSQHIILSNNDVRAEPYLTGLIIAAVYHYYRADIYNNFWHLLAGCIFAACAVMTKGMFALITIGSAIVGHLVITRQWHRLLHWRWLAAIILVGVFILPEVYSVYVQFDAHPEKVVFGQTGVSGVKFFFWDSQFGRFFNTGPIKGSGDLSFFVHTTLWAFLPWSLLLFAALFQYVKNGLRVTRLHEWYCVSGAMVTFLMFSVSKFQLPHYLNIVFPFFAIITAQYICSLKSAKTINTVRVVQGAIIMLLILLLAALHYFYSPETFGIATAALLFILVFCMMVLPRSIGVTWYEKTGFATILAACVVNVYLNLVFYPSVMKYQAGSEAAVWINRNNPQRLPVLQSVDISNFGMEFYLNQPMITISPDGSGDLPDKPFMLYAEAATVTRLSAKGWHIYPLKTFENYAITRLSPSFLNKATRNKEVQVTQLVIVRPQRNGTNKNIL
ncbi:glycosyl transferase [Mucilaginibacter hurinus]|uniref:Glycosyl transferase n=1 Tax=Mucilaginibacter hurinus TaxID=2201324 RepID=A0A367GTH3_9SPHI|nr:glycosyltransferase family 39 protein [Mucilaginibacter hurinus]RCH56580.1 glycosyl transferase [Mucilaginibacter hurinus]